MKKSIESIELLNSLNMAGGLQIREDRMKVSDYAALQSALPDGLPASSDKTPVKDFLAGVVGAVAEKNEHLKSMSMADLEALVHDLQPPKQEALSGPTHTLVPPTVFGEDEIPDGLMSKLTKQAKLYNGNLPVELALRYAADAHKGEKYSLSPAAYIKMILVLAPKEATPLVAAYAAQETPDRGAIESMYEDLQYRFGTLQSHSDLIGQVWAACDNATNSYKLAELLWEINQKAGGNREEISRLTAQMLLRHLEKVAPIGIYNGIKTTYLTSPRQDYRALFRIIRTHYKDALDNQIKVNQLAVTGELKTQAGIQAQLPLLPVETFPWGNSSAPPVQYVSDVAPPRNGFDKAGQQLCYGCGSAHHQVRNCPKQKNEMKTGPNSSPSIGCMRYCDLPCFKHGGHSNASCEAQNGICDFAEDHIHRQRECQRDIGPLEAIKLMEIMRQPRFTPTLMDPKDQVSVPAAATVPQDRGSALTMAGKTQGSSQLQASGSQQQGQPPQPTTTQPNQVNHVDGDAGLRAQLLALLLG